MPVDRWGAARSVDELNLAGQGLGAGIYDDKSEIAALSVFVQDKVNLQK